MKNSFDINEKSSVGFDSENDRAFAAASSPDQLAIVWNGAAEVVAASPFSVNNASSYEIDLARLPADFNLTAALTMRRENHLNMPALSEQTLLLTAVPDFSERTRILALNREVLAYDDDELVEWLLTAEKQMFLGTDNHPVFETSLEDTACSIRRLPNGLVAMTEVPRPHIQFVREKMRLLLGEDAPYFSNLSVETPLRCAARYFLTALPEGADVLREGKESEVTAFLLVNTSGFSYGLWSPTAGLFSEYAFPAPTEISNLKNDWAEKLGDSSNETVINDSRIYDQKSEATPDAASEDVENHRLDRRLEDYIRHAFDQLYLQLSPEKLEQLELSSYAQVVWATEVGLSGMIAPIAAEYSANTGLEFFQIAAPVDEVVAGGLLFGSFTFGDEIVAGAEILPPVNMARDILALADKEEIERRRIEEIRLQKQHNRAVFILLAAPIVVVACLLAMVADLVRTQTMMGFREQSADARTLELKPALDRRKSYEANLKWYQEFITQVSGLRRQQPVGIGMLYELNSNYPLTIDPSFYVSDLKLGNSGGNTKCFDCVEIKGLARNKDAITSFLRSLEFAGGPASGTKLFSNLAYEVQENAFPTSVPTGGQSNLPALTGSGLTGSNTAPGIIAWNIKGNYTPMAEFSPPDPTKTPALKPAPAAVATPTP
jgi:hypothetical protein